MDIQKYYYIHNIATGGCLAEELRIVDLYTSPNPSHLIGIGTGSAGSIIGAQNGLI